MNICPTCKSHMKFLWINMHLENGVLVSDVAKIAKVYPSTIYRWIESYEKHGMDGLVDKSRAHNGHPNEYSNKTKEKIRFLRKEGKGICADIIQIRMRKKFGIVVSRSGIAKFLKQEGLINEKLGRRIKNKKQRIKKCRIHEPGEVIQMDVKYAL